jgi:membrane protein implicated in regulation of membrane protease activity
MPYIWIAVTIAAVVAESLTSALVAIWFMPSAIITMILSFFTVPVKVQLLVFMVISVMLIVMSKTVFKTTLGAHARTNADAVIGEQAIVTERICNIENKGLVKVRGQIWSARSADGIDFEPGEIVSVISIEGVKLICRK